MTEVEISGEPRRHLPLILPDLTAGRVANFGDPAASAVRAIGRRSIASRTRSSSPGILVARALAQEAPVVVLDEPTNHLDIRHQLELMELLRELGLTTLMAIHDLNLAAAYCDSVHVLQAGRLVASGLTRDVLTPELIEAVFEVRCTRHDEPGGGLRLSFVPLASDPDVS